MTTRDAAVVVLGGAADAVGSGFRGVSRALPDARDIARKN